MHFELAQKDDGRWVSGLMLGDDAIMVSEPYASRLALDDDLARMAKALGEGGAARIPVVTVHEHGGQVVLGGCPGTPDEHWRWVWAQRADGAYHAAKGATEFASLADWLPAGE